MSQTDLLRETGARFSPCRTYRYLLWRIWDERKPLVNFLMLNPSTADEVENDPTVARCEAYARRWGDGGLVVTNLYALRSTDPRALIGHPKPVGPANDLEIRLQATRSGLVVAAWGNHGAGRAREVVAALHREGVVLHCLGVNKTGEPVHPLYQRRDTLPRLYLTGAT